MYDKRTLQNPLLMWRFIEKYPEVDSSLIDPMWEFCEAENEMKRRHPEQMIEKPKKDDLLSVNSFIHFTDLTNIEHECDYCGKTFKRKRSTKKYCSKSHRVLMFRKRRRQFGRSDIDDRNSITIAYKHPLSKGINTVVTICRTMKFIIDGTAGIMMHPARFQILHVLREAKEPMYVDQIAEATEINARMVSHHLDVLEEQELVKSEYKLAEAKGSKRKVAVRLSFATQKAEEVIKNIQESISQVKK